MATPQVATPQVATPQVATPQVAAPPVDAAGALAGGGGAPAAAPIDEAATPTAEAYGPAAPPVTSVGVVFVHGIGSQLAGETLFDWTAPIVRTVWAWAEQVADPTAGRPFQDPVEVAEVDLTGATTPIIQLLIPAVPGHDQQRWVLTEAWWAADVRPPSVSRMLDWLFGQGEVRRILVGIIAGLRRAAQRRGSDPLAPDGPLEAPRRRGVIDVLDAVFISALFLLLATIIVPIYGLLRVLGSLPIPKLKDAVSTAQIDWFVREWFGDVRVLLMDRAQAANLRNRLATAILKLRAYGADSIVVVAHSGGTVLSYMLLADPEYDDLEVDKLITHGQALGLAWRLGHRDDAVRPAFDVGLRDGDRLLGSAHRASVDGRPSTLRWVDFHATHDPAPAFSAFGWPTDGDHPDESWTVTNRMSVRNDHGGYWDNEEQFVIPLLRELDTPGAAPAASRFFDADGPQRDRVLRRTSRVRGLAIWWNLWMAMLAIAVIGGLLATVVWSGGFLVIGAATAQLIGPIPVLGLAAALPAWVLGLIVVVVVFAFHGTSAIGDWDKLDIDERSEARRLTPSHLSRSRMRGRFVLYLVACLAMAVFAIAPYAPTLVVALVTGLVAHGPDAVARSLSFAGRVFDPGERLDRPTRPPEPPPTDVDGPPGKPGEPGEPGDA